MDPENNNPVAVPDASQLNAAGADGTVQNVPATDGMTLSEINAALGKNFPNKEAALKSFKYTFSYVGKKVEDVKKEVMAEVQSSAKTDQLAQELAEMRKERFYDKNPKYADANVRAIIEASGKSPAEFVETPAFKAIFEKVSGYDESQKLKTVLESNPRLSSSRDSLTKAREIASKTDRPTEEVESMVANAVKDAYGL